MERWDFARPLTPECLWGEGAGSVALGAHGGGYGVTRGECRSRARLGLGDGDLVLVADLERVDDDRVPFVVENQLGAAGVHRQDLAVEVDDLAARGAEAPGVGRLQFQVADQLRDALVRLAHVASAVLGRAGGDVAQEDRACRGHSRLAAEGVRDDDEAVVGVDHDHAAGVEQLREVGVGDEEEGQGVEGDVRVHSIV